jgi:hypothetical protein
MCNGASFRGRPVCILRTITTLPKVPAPFRRVSGHTVSVVEREFYEAVLPLARDELAQLSSADEPLLARLAIEDLTLEQSDEHGTHLALTFRDPDRPNCLFGWRWSWAEDPKPDEVEFAAATLRVNLEEDLLSEGYGLPADCEPGGVTWF